MGGGPSLSQTPLDLLTNEVTIASNSIFLLFGETNFRPTFYTVEDRLVAEDRAAAINQLQGMPKIFPADVWRYLKEDEDTIYVNFKRSEYDGFPKFSGRLDEVVYWGGTVTFMNLQLAWHLGCREVYLVGIDHSYQPPSPVDKVEGNVITSQSADVNHFHPDYFGPGYRWHDPRVDRMERGYLEARRFFTEHGGVIYNATIGGKLEVFPRVKLEDVTGLNRETEDARAMNTRVDQMRDLWNSLSRKSKFGFISHLQKGQEAWDPIEFHLAGIRFVDRMAERITEYGTVEPALASIAEIGCGVGRFLKPLGCRFKSVLGIDISQEMLDNARDYCAGIPNVTFFLNDGKTLNGIDGNSFNYCVSAGVFQHITDFDIIASYIREALRIIKPDGLFLFQFEGNRTEAVGSGRQGAKIIAKLLNEKLRGAAFSIKEISIDPQDKVRNIVVVLQKSPNRDWDFQSHPMIERRWISGIYDDIRTKTQMQERQAKPMMPLTFYD